MATVQEAVKRLTYVFTSDGADKVAADLKTVNDGQAAVSATSQKTEQASLSLEKSFSDLERRYISGLKAQQDYEKIQRTVNAAVEQNPELQSRANAVMAAASEQLKKTAAATDPLAELMNKARGAALGLAAGIGPLGAVLGSFGVAGVVVSAVLGGLAAAYKFVAEESERMGDRAIDLQKTAKELEQLAGITELTVGQIKGLHDAGDELGVDSKKIDTAIEGLTGRLNQAQSAAGTLFTAVRSLDGGLAMQLAASRSTAAGVDILAKAYSNAEGAQAKAALARAVFPGRDAAVMGPVLGKVDDAGSIAELSKATKELSATTDYQNKRWAEMREETKKLQESAKNIFASIFTEEGLAASLSAAKNMERLAKAAKETAEVREGLSWWQNFVLDIAHMEGGPAAHGPDIARLEALQAAQQRMAKGSGTTNLGADKESIDSWGKLSDAMRGVVATIAEVEDTTKTLQDIQKEAATTYNLLSTRMSALGDAATIAEKGQQRLAKIELDRLTHVFSLDDAENNALAVRAKSIAQVDAAIAQTGAYVGALGPLATVQDLVRQKMLAVTKANAEGAGLSKTQIADIKNLTAANAEWARVTEAAGIGVYNLAAAGKAAGDEFEAWKAKKLFDPNDPLQYAAAQQVMAEKLRQAKETAELAATPFKQLKQLQLDAANSTKAFDAFASTSLNTFTDSLASVVTGATDAKTAFHSMAMAILNDLAKMAIRTSITGPIAGALSGLLRPGGNSSLGTASSATGAAALTTAGTSLSAAATALMQAAVSLGAKGVAGIGAGGFNPLAMFSGSAGSGGAGTMTGNEWMASGQVYAANELSPLDIAAGVAHTGGIVGSGAIASRYVHPAYFDNAPRFAMGGIAGLGPDEVPIVAHRDEEVIRRDDPRHRYNNSGAGGGSSFAPVYNIDATGADPAALARLEKALDRHARATAMAFQQADQGLTGRQTSKRLLSN